jgi:hypothetical protein
MKISRSSSSARPRINSNAPAKTPAKKKAAPADVTLPPSTVRGEDPVGLREVDELLPPTLEASRTGGDGG